jgi:hypothetical protein
MVNLLIYGFLIHPRRNTQADDGGMVLDRLETAEALGMFGGTLAALNWVPAVLFLARVQYLMLLYGGVLVFLPAVTGFFVCGLSFRAATMAQKMPDRAKRDFNAAGIVGVVVGIFCFFNFFLVVSSIFVLIAGSEAGAVVDKIARARRQTGFPLGTVATATGSPWHRRLSCAYCGAPLVVMSVAPRGPDVQVDTSCPLDKTHDRQRLPLSQLEEWATVLADRLHRCEQCGERTAALLLIHQGAVFTTLRPYCPVRHSTPLRRIWTPVYSHVSRSPAVDVTYQPADVPSRFAPTIRVYGPEGIQPLQPFSRSSIGGSTPPVPRSTVLPWESVVPTRAAYPTRFCRICGARIEPTDRFCYQCGAMIQ